MDQGDIECPKRRYSKKLNSAILLKMELGGKGLIDALKTIHIKDVILMVVKAFDEILNSTFIKS